MLNPVRYMCKLIEKTTLNTFVSSYPYIKVENVTNALSMTQTITFNMSESCSGTKAWMLNDVSGFVPSVTNLFEE